MAVKLVRINETWYNHPARGSGPLSEAAAVLNKPFRKRDLTRRLRAALGCGPA